MLKLHSQTGHKDGYPDGSISANHTEHLWCNIVHPSVMDRWSCWCGAGLLNSSDLLLLREYCRIDYYFYYHFFYDSEPRNEEIKSNLIFQDYVSELSGCIFPFEFLSQQKAVMQPFF